MLQKQKFFFNPLIARRDAPGRPGMPRDAPGPLQNPPEPSQTLGGGWVGIILGGQNSHFFAPNKKYLSLKHLQKPNKTTFEVGPFFKIEMCMNSHLFVKLQYNFKPAPDAQFSL